MDVALAKIEAESYVVGITTDILFPPNEMQVLCERIPGARYFEIDSLFGHDGFLVEYEQFNDLLRPIMR